MGYSLDAQSFKPRTSVHLWASGEWPEWKVRYKLFKRFGVVNARLLREDARRPAQRERGEPSMSGGKKRKRENKLPAPTVVAVDLSDGPTRKRLLLEEEEESTMPPRRLPLMFLLLPSPLSAEIQAPLWECLRIQGLKTRHTLASELPWTLNSILIPT